MPTNFPTSVDNFTNPIGSDPRTSPDHAAQHANANDAIEAIETYVINRELSYVEKTSNTSVTATTEATANTVVTAAAVTFDGATAVVVEFYAPIAFPAAVANAAINFWLYDGANSIGRLGNLSTVAAANHFAPVYLSRRLTPSGASHTYSIRASVSSGTGGVQAGAGGITADMPAFIRITRA